MGYKAGYNSTTTSNHVMIGYEAGFNNTIGGNNTFIGQRGGYNNTEGENNTAVGFQAGYYNTTGDGNVFIGKSAGPSSTNTDSNKLYIHNAAGTPLIAGDFSAGSVTINGSITGTTNAAITNNMTIGTNVDLQGAGNSTFAGGNTIFGASNVSQNTYLKVLGSGAGYTAAGIKLLTYNGSNRPGGVYSYAHDGTQAWYSGPVYGTSYTWGVNYKSSIADTGSSLEAVADDGNNLLSITTAGNVGIGTVAANQKLEVAGNITTTALDTEYRFGNRSDLLIRGHSDFDMELISPQDMAFSIDSDNNETAHKFLFKTNTTTPRSAGTTLMEISEAGDVAIAGGLGVTGSTLAVQKTMKNDIAGNHTISDSYSHYMATGDNQTGSPTCTITCPANPSVGDEYFIVAQCIYNSALPSNALVQITPNTGQTINMEVGAGSNIAIHQVSSGTGAGGGPLISYKTAHLICIDGGQWVLTISDVGPTS